MQPDPLNCEKPWEKKRGENSVTCMDNQRIEIVEKGGMKKRAQI